MLFQDAITKYGNYKGIRHERASVVYKWSVIKFKNFNKKTLITEVDNDDVTAYQMYLKKNYEDSTQALHASALRSFFTFTNGRGWTKVSLSEIDVPRVIEKVPVYVVQSEYETLCDIAKNDPMKLLVLKFLWDTGVRCQELCDINIDVLDLKECCTKIIGKKIFRPRFVFWSEETNRLLLEVISHRNSGPLFISNRGTRVCVRQVERWIKGLVKEAGIKKAIVPHSFRHGMVHENLSIGTDLPAIQAMMGHKNPHSIFKYTKRLEEDIKEVGRETIRKRNALSQIKRVVEG